MRKHDFLLAVTRLGLAPVDYIVIGSGVLCALGIRDVDDVDLIVSEQTFKNFESSGEWRRKNFEDGSYYLVNGIYEVGLDWDSQNAIPNLAELKVHQLIIENMPFISLERLKSWKLKKGREKDFADIKLIDEYLYSTHP